MRLVINHDHLLLDASSGISLYASGQMQAMIDALPVRVGIVDVVRVDEMKYVKGGPMTDEKPNNQPIDIEQLICDGFLTELEMTDVEYALSVDLAALGLENGECCTAAVAFHRNAAVAIDDGAARRHFSQSLPNIQLVSTSQIVQYWGKTNNISELDLRGVLIMMRERGGYTVSAKDVLYDWLRQFL